MTELRQALVRQEITEQGKLRFIMTVPVIWNPKPKFLDRFKKKKEPETTKEFVFDPAVIGKVSQIAGKISGMPNELYGDTPAELASDVIERHYKDMIYIIAVSTHKSVKEPSEELLRFIEMNFTFDMLTQGAQIAIAQLQLDAFLNCLMIFKGTSSILIPKSSHAEREADPTSIISKAKSNAAD